MYCPGEFTYCVYGDAIMFDETDEPAFFPLKKGQCQFLWWYLRQRILILYFFFIVVQEEIKTTTTKQWMKCCGGWMRYVAETA